MGEIVVHEFMTVDGVFEDPSWTRDFSFDPKMGEAIGAMMGSCKALLLGHRTFGAPFMNESPKYVVSSTLQSAEWNNSTILGPYDPERIRALKDQVGGNFYVSGSGTLVRAMLADGLVDALHLFVYPVALSSGERLFADGSRPAKFTLEQSESYSSGVVHLAYRPSR